MMASGYLERNPTAAQESDLLKETRPNKNFPFCTSHSIILAQARFSYLCTLFGLLASNRIATSMNR